MSTNHLTAEKSPYLLQHAHNPVDWYPWGPQAFEQARTQGKPVLLSIGYSTCHWCHVMAHESFEDEHIAKIMNEHFVAIKVDREERPDIDHIYMTAVTAMTGQGGWPLTVFLTPEGQPFYGGTYFPPYAKWGSPGFTDVLGSIAAAWKNDRENILSSSRSLTESLQRHMVKEPSSEILDETILDRAYRYMRGQFDPANGGFGGAPKFPMGHNWTFLLRYYKHTGTDEVLAIVDKTLTSMGRGGIWDHLGGGFHRYSTDQNWHVPHFEKMLYDQALLSRAYLEGYQVTGSADYARIAREIFDYVLKDMADPLGGFYSAEDADSLEHGHLKEGAFYVFSQSEIVEALGDEVAKIFNYCYGVLPQGNAAFDPHGEFAGKNILYEAHSAQEAAGEFHMQTDEIQDILISGKTKLLSIRQSRPRPHIDNKVLCDWNGLMIASLAFGSRVLGEPQYRDAARKAADFILGHLMSKGRLWHRWREGDAGIAGTLEDYAFFIYGLLEVYEATFEEKYLDAAQVLADRMIEFFADKAGGFYMTATDAEALIVRPKEIYDGALPSGNSVAALVLLRLHTLTQKMPYQQQVDALFKCFASGVSQAPGAHTFLLSALGWSAYGPLEITLEGPGDSPAMTQMLKIIYKHFIPYKTIKFVHSGMAAKAHVCFRGACQPAVDRADMLERQLLSGG